MIMVERLDEGDLWFKFAQNEVAILPSFAFFDLSFTYLWSGKPFPTAGIELG